jgi:hypothetical protein
MTDFIQRVRSLINERKELESTIQKAQKRIADIDDILAPIAREMDRNPIKLDMTSKPARAKRTISPAVRAKMAAARKEYWRKRKAAEGK